MLRPSREIWRPVRTKGLTLFREVYELGGEEGGMFMMVAWYMYIYPISERAGLITKSLAPSAVSDVADFFEFCAYNMLNTMYYANLH